MFCKIAKAMKVKKDKLSTCICAKDSFCFVFFSWVVRKKNWKIAQNIFFQSSALFWMLPKMKTTPPPKQNKKQKKINTFFEKEII